MLDRLNALLEPGGVLTMSERGVIDGTIPTIAPHPNFRYFVFLLYFLLVFFFSVHKIGLEKQLSTVIRCSGISNAARVSEYCSVTVCLARKKLHGDKHRICSLGGLASCSCSPTDFYIGKFIAVYSCLDHLFLSNLVFQHFSLSL